ncbi:MAG: class I adenylate-forming enzyme family protein [Haliea sp.]|uniref:class I adenylate-forming enzyme family protein n=1 Tax=Marinobacter salarius TaxID=1420917 RepID=UPI0032EFA4CB
MMPALANNLGDLSLGRVDSACEVLVDLRLADAPRHFSAGKLHDAISAFARGLVKAGVQPSERVAFLSANRWELLVGYFASMLMGAVAVPVNHKLPAETVAHIIMDSGAAIVFYDAARQPLVPEDRKSLGFDEHAGADFQRFLDPGEVAVYAPAPHDLAEILYTSGSTGAPKGVPLTHAGQTWALGEYLEESELPSFSRTTLIVAPMYHMNALFFTSSCLLNRIRCVLQPRFDAQDYVEAAVHYGCSMLSGVPTMFALAAALSPDVLPPGRDCVKSISMGSAPLPPSLLTQLKAVFPAAEISNGYGSTEAGPAIFGPHPAGLPKPPLSIGYPRRGIEWRLVDGDSPEQGRLQLQTPAMTAGYLNRPDASAEKFVDGWFDTGDILRRDDQGFMYFVARADDMFVSGGENIYPSQVEALLARHPAVQDVVVVGAPDDIKGTVPVAFVVPKAGAEPSELELRDHCLAVGPAYAHPRRILFIKRLPVGGTHKVDRKKLTEEATILMIAEGRSTAADGSSGHLAHTDAG